MPRTMLNRLSLTAATVAVAALALTGCSVGTDSADTGSANTGSTKEGGTDASSSAPKAAGIGTPVKVGAFEYTVIAAKEAGTSVGKSPLTQKAQGSYYRVDVTIANIGNEPETFLVNYVTLVDAEGKSYDADSTATIYAAPDTKTWISAINPGNSVQGPILFDVPAGTKPTAIEVSDSAFGTGESISLG